MNVKQYIESGIVEAYVLGMLNKDELAEVEAEMIRHSEVADAVREAEETMGNFSQAYSIAPKPEWRNDIIANALAANEQQDTSKVFTLNQTEPTDYQDENTSKSGSGKSTLAVAATIALFISVGFNVFQFTKLNNFDDALLSANMRIAQLETQNNSVVANYQSLENDLDIFRNPATAKFVMNPVEGRAANLRADVLWNAETEMVYVDVKNLPQPPTDKQYQLWALVDGKPVDMGVFDIMEVDNGLQRMQKIPGADAFAVTLERKGGVASPTMDQMFVYGTPLAQA